MSAEPINLELVAVKMELARLRETVNLQVQLGYSVKEAAQVTNIGETELRNRIASPAQSAVHIRVVRVGRKIIVPRSECERLLKDLAR
jgi:DNA-directed RNA polymerase specialized sigma24 family protein